MRKGSIVLAALCVSLSAAAQELAGIQTALRTDKGGGASFGLLYDGRAAQGPTESSPVAAEGASGAAAESGLGRATQPGLDKDAGVPAPAPEGKTEQSGGVVDGVKHGASEGALLGFYAVLSPAVSLLSEGFGRAMSRHYDGARGDNGNAKAYETAGIVLGAVLYVPALAVGAATGTIGALAGAASEAVKPGSTKGWDAEKQLFG